MTPAPTSGHQRVVKKLIVVLDRFVENHALGEVFPGPIHVLFAEGDYLEPDLVFVRAERAALCSSRWIEACDLPDRVWHDDFACVSLLCMHMTHGPPHR